MNFLGMLLTGAVNTNVGDSIGTPNGFCYVTAGVWQIVGRVLMVARIIFAILVIIFGIIDIGKSVTSQKPEEITKSFKSLAFRLGAALAIFFIPTIVGYGIRLANAFNQVDADYKICAACIENGNGQDCSNAVAGSKTNP